MERVPSDVAAALHQLEEELEEGDITQKGYLKRRTQILESSGLAHYLAFEDENNRNEQVSEQDQLHAYTQHDTSDYFAEPFSEVLQDEGHAVLYDSESLSKSSGSFRFHPEEKSFGHEQYEELPFDNQHQAGLPQNTNSNKSFEYSPLYGDHQGESTTQPQSTRPLSKPTIIDFV